MSVLALIPAILTAAAIVYYGIALFAARDFLRQKSPTTAALPPVSILKPLKGADRGIYESLRSHCVQDYPQFEIIFGVNDAGDPAVPYIDRLKSEFPDIAIRTLISAQVLGANRKVSNLAQMLEQARFDHILINDGDIRVPVNYLRDVMTWFSESKVGMVTCLYRALAGKTLCSKLEALGISGDFIPGVLTARYLDGGVRFALGSTMACSKEALNAIGGLRPLVDHLADDYELGKRISDAGYKVVISAAVVETFLPNYGFMDFFEHQLRWGRTVRSSRPAGYLGLGTTFGLFWALLTMLASSGVWWSWILLASVLILRVATMFVIGQKIFADRDFWRDLWLLPVRDLTAPVVWLTSLFGNRIVWRGEVFTLCHGKLRRN